MKHWWQLCQTCVMPSVFVGFASAPFKSETLLKLFIMKFFKNDQQEIKFNIIVTVVALAIYIILSTLRQSQ